MSFRLSATVTNILGYQLAWFACVLGAMAGRHWPGVLVTTLFVLATLWLGGKRRADLRMLAIVAPLGFAIDSAFAAGGWLAYSPGGPAPLAPGWIAAIWAAFAMTLNHSLAALRRHRLLASALGFAGGPLAYWSASAAFGVLRFPEPALPVLLALGLAWALLLPLAFALDEHRPLSPEVQP